MAEDSDHAVELEEYRQLCEYHRHEDRMKWTILGLGYVAAGALVGLSVAKGSTLSIGGFASAVLAVALVVCATLIYHNIQRDAIRRVIRLHAIENHLGMWNLRSVGEPPAPPKHSLITANGVVDALALVFVVLVCVSIVASLLVAGLALG